MRMDILAHALWSAWPFRLANLRNKNAGKKRFNLWLPAFWGVFPDLFAFTIPFLWIIFGLLTGSFSFANIPTPDSLEPIANHHIVFQLANVMYSMSHSLIIFSLIFLAVCLIFRKPVWVMLTWLMHILIDIPSHSYKFYPTPIFWPFSDWKFDGISWTNGWFMAINYSSLVIIYALAFYYEKKREGKKLSLKKLKRLKKKLKKRKKR